MKIQRIETFTKGNISIVRVRTDDGSEGFGQIAPFHADISALVLHRQVAPHVLGADAFNTEGLCDRVIEAEYKFPGSYVCRALAGLDTALWDLHGKLEGRSVCAMLGGKPKPLEAYGSSMRRDIQPKDEAERLCRLCDRQGFKAFKIRIGRKCGHNEDEWPGRTQQLVPMVRKSLGPDIGLFVDANSCYTPKEAIAVGRMLEDNMVGHFEEPCPYWEIEWTAQVAAALDVPVAGGEQDCDLAQWRRIIEMNAVDIVQPDVCYVGGLTRAMRVAGMAERAGKKCVPHSANHSLVTIFTMHMLCAIPNAGRFFEFSIEPNEWVKELYAPTLQVRDGSVMLPDGPGWGVTILPAWLESAQRLVSEVG